MQWIVLKNSSLFRISFRYKKTHLTSLQIYRVKVTFFLGRNVFSLPYTLLLGKILGITQRIVSVFLASDQAILGHARQLVGSFICVH